MYGNLDDKDISFLRTAARRLSAHFPSVQPGIETNPSQDGKVMCLMTYRATDGDQGREFYRLMRELVQYFGINCTVSY